MWVVAIGDGDGRSGEMRVAVMRWWVGIMKDDGGGGWGRKQFIVDAQIEHRQKLMLNLGVVC